jgi:hypothetical protein
MRQAVETENAPLLDTIAELERAIEVTASALDEGGAEIQREAISLDPGYADADRFAAKAVEVAALNGLVDDSR